MFRQFAFIRRILEQSDEIVCILFRTKAGSYGSLFDKGNELGIIHKLLPFG